jgi:tryptophan synthase alpha chain
MSRIAARFAALKREGRGALIPFVEAWDPDAATSMELLRGFPGAGADLVEIGIPFTDPMADGPIIQAAGKDVLTMVQEFRPKITRRRSY